MTKDEARIILNRVREGYAMPLAITTQALQRTGDIPRIPDKPLRSDGDEPCHDRPCQIHEQIAQVGFSYSAYLDCPKTESAT